MRHTLDLFNVLFEYEPYAKCVCLVDVNDECHVFSVDYVRSVINELSK